MLQNLYFLAIIPNEEICEQIECFKMDFAKHYRAPYALRVMPHITLKKPFTLPESEHNKLKHWFSKLVINVPAFEVALKNFGSFPNRKSPVIYVNPVENDLLYSLQREIVQQFQMLYPQLAEGVDKSFSPHMTIAYHDLIPDEYRKAWEVYQFKSYQASFDVNSFHLLQHDRTRWNVIDTHYMCSESVGF